MTDFKPITLDAREEIESYFKNSDTRLAELNFTNIFTWDHAFHASWAVVCGSLVLRMDFKDADGPWFTMPVGTGDLADVFGELEKISSACGVPLRIRSVSEEQLPEVTALFPDTFDVSIKESYSDYIYTAEKLATLAGKKLHSKRNHINRFESEGTWYVRPYRPESYGECRAFAEEWFETNAEERGVVYDSEETALWRLLDNFDDLSADGMMLYQNGRLVAFTFGEVMSRDTFLVHFEKAKSGVNGAYPMINREFARFVLTAYPQVRYINREEDMGIEGLRRAKQSYYPVMMGKKYMLTKKSV